MSCRHKIIYRAFDTNTLRPYKRDTLDDLRGVRLRVSASAADALANFLSERIRAGFELRDPETLLAIDHGLVEFVVWLAPDDIEPNIAQANQYIKSLRATGIDTIDLQWRVDEKDDGKWLTAYKDHFKTTRIGAHFIVKPTWESAKPNPDDHIIELDPGTAFGTGLHASTRLVLRALERMHWLGPSPASLIDIGCGSGILAIAAAKLWPDIRIFALDIDPIAVKTAQANIANNGLTNRVDVAQGNIMSFTGSFDLILANLSYDVLSGSRESFAQHMHPFGRVALSGLLTEQAAQLCDEYCADLRFEPEFSQDDDGWRGLILRLHGD